MCKEQKQYYLLMFDLHFDVVLPSSWLQETSLMIPWVKGWVVKLFIQSLWWKNFLFSDIKTFLMLIRLTYTSYKINKARESD